MSARVEPNGMAVVDRLLRAHGRIASDEVWVHGLWTPDKWWACLWAKLRGKRLVRMTHGGLSPIYLTRQGKWKKRLVRPIERLMFALADRIVGTGEWEVEWARAWGLTRPIETIDLTAFFRLPSDEPVAEAADGRSVPLHVLYLGRRHPLKGLGYLEQAAVAAGVELRVVTDHTGAELEADWSWCDVLCLPTLSENFGLVVAEALERGKRAITTDGAPAWGPSTPVEGPSLVPRYGGRLLYLAGYCAGGDEVRTALLTEALQRFAGP